VPPFLLRSDDNPEGPLTQDKADEMRSGLEKDREAFFDGFTRDFFSANGQLMVTEETRQAPSRCAINPTRRRRWAACTRLPPPISAMT
jgi:hypothetical protein